MTPIVIDSEQALAEFRASRFSAGALAPVILSSPISLINAPIGVGKSTLLDDLLEHFLADDSFDLIVVLAALTANLLERRLVRTPTPEVRRLRPRPRVDCGPLDLAWRLHERNGTAAYGKRHLCRACAHFDLCYWPGQYGSALNGARVIFGTHQHLLVNPRFLLHLSAMTGAERLLLLLDEAEVLAAPFRTTLTPWVLTQFVAAVRSADVPDDVRRVWAERTTLLYGSEMKPALPTGIAPSIHAVFAFGERRFHFRSVLDPKV
jgi:hypothetical protein